METPPQVLPEIDAFAKDLAREDDLGAVVRAHIRIENCLVELVEHALVAPVNLARMNLEYDDYVSLALAQGLDNAWGPCLRGLGTLRNKFAHKLDAAIDLQTVNNLYASLPPAGKIQVQASLKRIRTQDPGGAALPEKYANLPPADQFKLIALIVWSGLKALQIKKVAQHDA